MLNFAFSLDNFLKCNAMGDLGLIANVKISQTFVAEVPTSSLHAWNIR